MYNVRTPSFYLLVTGQIYFVQRNNIRMMFYLVIQVHGKENRNTDIGDACAVPVDFRSRKCRVVLASRDDDTHEQGQQGAEGKERSSIGQVF